MTLMEFVRLCDQARTPEFAEPRPRPWRVFLPGTWWVMQNPVAFAYVPDLPGTGAADYYVRVVLGAVRFSRDESIVHLQEMLRRWDASVNTQTGWGDAETAYKMTAAANTAGLRWFTFSWEGDRRDQPRGNYDLRNLRLFLEMFIAK
jgi:hypothetical protein